MVVLVSYNPEAHIQNLTTLLERSHLYAVRLLGKSALISPRLIVITIKVPGVYMKPARAY